MFLGMQTLHLRVAGLIAAAFAVSLATTPIAAQSVGLLVTEAAAASSSTPTMAQAVDGDPRTAWRSGTAAPGWLELTLSHDALPSRIRLLPLPRQGDAAHVVEGITAQGTVIALARFEGTTGDSEWIELNSPGSTLIRRLRVHTTRGPAVGWREIELINGGDLRRSCSSTALPEAVAVGIEQGSVCPQGRVFVLRPLSSQPPGVQVLSCQQHGLPPGWRVEASRPAAGTPCQAFDLSLPTDARRIHLLVKTALDAPGKPAATESITLPYQPPPPNRALITWPTDLSEKGFRP